LCDNVKTGLRGLNSGVLEAIPEDGGVGSVRRNRNLEGNSGGTEGHGRWKLEAGRQEWSGLASGNGKLYMLVYVVDITLIALVGKSTEVAAIFIR
jgi:hypothetical protein